MEAGTAAREERIARPEILLQGLRPQQRGWLRWLTTTDHKRIGILYLCATFLFFILGGVEALIMRLQLAQPDNTSAAQVDRGIELNGHEETTAPAECRATSSTKLPSKARPDHLSKRLIARPRVMAAVECSTAKPRRRAPPNSSRVRYTLAA